MGNRHAAAGAATAVPTSTFGTASAALQAPDTPRNGELEQRRLEFRREAARACQQLTQKHNAPSQSNVFLMPQHGLDVDAVAAKICELGAFNLNYVAKDYADDYQRAAQLQRRHGERAWVDAHAALSVLRNAGEQHVALFASRHSKQAGARNRALSRVFVYTQSPVEDQHIRLPMLLDSLCDTHTIAEERIVLNNRFRMICDSMSIYNCVWVYLRMSDACWALLLEQLKLARVADQELMHMCEYRARMEAFFGNNEFADGYHTLRIDIESMQLDSDLVAHNVAKILADFIHEQYTMDMWSPAADDELFVRYIRSIAYKEQRVRNAVAAQWLAGPQRGAPHDRIRAVPTSDMAAQVTASLSLRGRRSRAASSVGSSDSPRASVSLSMSRSGSRDLRLRPTNPAGSDAGLIASAPIANVYDQPAPMPVQLRGSGSTLAEFRRMNASQPAMRSTGMG
jgi:hypothetical protein